MTIDQFNDKWKDYLEEGHYGLAIKSPEVIEYLDKVFEDLTKIPNFSFAQIKTKFGFSCFYADGISLALRSTIELKLNSILKEEKDDKN